MDASEFLTLRLAPIGRLVTETITESDVEALARLYVQLAEAKARMADWCRDTEQALADVMPDKRLELEDLPVLERRQGKDRKKWRSDELLSYLVRGALVDPETGEVETDPLALRDRLVSELTACVPFTGSLGWRVMALRERDVPIDEFCETFPGKVTVQVHEAREAA